ncbi:MAG: branched-chain amino acid ABC transporter permease [Candidatus Dormibacteria bacterium]
MFGFLLTVLTYVGFQVILTLGLNIQFGVTGMLNLAYIVFMAVGAYVTAVVMLPPAQPPFTYYVLGLRWPFPVAMVLGVLAAGALAAVLGLVALGPRLRKDYLGIATLVTAAAIAQGVAQFRPLFNGFQGLIDIPQPFGSRWDPTFFDLAFLLLVSGVALVVFLLAERIRRSPMGRTLRAIREDEVAARAFGTNIYMMKLKAFVIGAMIAGAAGALTAVYVTAFTTSGWAVGETIVALTCVFIGGAGNNWGSLLGAFVVVAVVNQGLEVLLPLLPAIPSDPSFIPVVQVMLVNLLLILVLRWRPRGLFPERVVKLPERFRSAPVTSAEGR